ncbi:hypothetical protein PODOV005v1_20005 [Vibrio phage PS32B.2]|nr:hypothetical protein PODOV005v1_20005 [Vibrio phage PS32B.2]QZI86299.1 hypothetical protein PODOV028v1_10008 [Vibrio phage PS32B.3]QZI86394.1 hypothetical protein PODOV029v1_30001 [Vibrio phage PS35B.1]QZI86456.1 hypothetical protein PODOV027v1_10047 [Vibrio phage PS35B.3]QZI92188.1 hypothetical protein PODOV026v1_p0015 [Vibrio phage PS32B.1]QZI92293.1 hypothetical protein PODOV004v1_p0058 [Vibrio phage PS32B.11]QZI92312.1 hypothetical protein PODOV025v1_p0015 [Vibrio phage PS32B.6]
MKQRILVVVNDTHAHLLPEGACDLTIKTATKDVNTTLRYIPYLKCFKDSPESWVVKEHLISPEAIGVNYNNASRYHLCATWLIDNLRNQGLTVV